MSDAPANPRRRGKRGRVWRLTVLVACAVLFIALTFYCAWWQQPWPNPHRPPGWLELQRYTYPVEFNATSRLPHLQNTRIREIHVSDDGKSLWVAGDNALLLHSDDGGLTWSQPKIDWSVPMRTEQVPIGKNERENAPFDAIQNLSPPPPPAPQQQQQQTAPEPKKAAGLPFRKRLEVGGAGVEPGALLAAAPPPDKSSPAAAVPSPSPSYPAPAAAAVPAPAPAAPKTEPVKVEPAPVDLSVQQAPPSLSDLGFSFSEPTFPRLREVSPDDAHFVSVAVGADGIGFAAAIVQKSTLSHIAKTGSLTGMPHVALFQTLDGGASWSLHTVFERQDKATVRLHRSGAVFPTHFFLVIEGRMLFEHSGGFSEEWSPVEWKGEPLYARAGMIAAENHQSGRDWIIGSTQDEMVKAWKRENRSEWQPHELPDLRDLKVGDWIGDFEYLTADERAGLLALTSRDATVYLGLDEKAGLKVERMGEDPFLFSPGMRLGTESQAVSQATPGWDWQQVLTTNQGVSLTDFLPRWPHNYPPSLSANGLMIVRHNGSDVISISRPDSTAPTYWDEVCVTYRSVAKEPQYYDDAQTRVTGPPGHYWRLPALFYYPLASLLLGGMVFAARRLREAEAKDAEDSTLADHFISDRPLRPGEPDALGSAKLAHGLANYIRNESTGLPLSIAITGAWGSGKSSILNLLAAELRRGRCRVVEFNAWHHQSEEHVLAALLEGIRSQAVPPVMSLDGLLFRWRLAWMRLIGSWLRAALYCGLGAAGAVILGKNWEFFTTVFHQILPTAAAGDGAAKNLHSLGGVIDLVVSKQGVGGLAGLGTIILTLRRALGSLAAFGVDPSKLLVQASSVARLADLKGSTSLRHQFAREFRQITAAMAADMRMVLFIDDLDRCQPAHVASMLENVNFLTSSGECAIVLGMDDEMVKDSLASSFDWRLKLESGGKPITRENGHRFASNWLEKLVQVSIAVPRLTEASLEPLLQNHTDDEKEPEAPKDESAAKETPPPLKRLLERGKRFWRATKLMLLSPRLWRFTLKTGVVAALVGGAVMLASLLDLDVGEPAKKAEASAVTAQIRGSSETPPDSLAGMKKGMLEIAEALDQTRKQQIFTQNTDPAALNHSEAVIEPGGTSAPWWLLLVLPAVLATTVRVWQTLRRQLVPPVQDTPEVLAELKRWLTPLEDRLDTLRSLKGFLNKVRFYDMMNRPLTEEEKRVEVAPEQLVAFGALSYLAPDALTNAQNALPAALSKHPECQKQAQAVLDILRGKSGDAELRAHLHLLSHSWRKRQALPEKPAPTPATFSA